MQPLSFDESNILLINPLAKNKERNFLVAGTEKAECNSFSIGVYDYWLPIRQLLMAIGHDSYSY